MEVKAQDQRSGPDPLRHEARDSSQTPASGSGLRRDRMRSTLLLTLRYFVDLRALKEHFKTKGHKKRLKQLCEEPYTQAEAERAAGMGSYIPPKSVEVKTQPVEEDMD
nr:zinc finger protein 593 isoform X2 [Nothobranchius furzeri]XP_054597619.1 zinc finger protein 593 isoform X2 [Nothobranchius furzeri]